jgi:hypothetical protein
MAPRAAALGYLLSMLSKLAGLFRLKGRLRRLLCGKPAAFRGKCAHFNVLAGREGSAFAPSENRFGLPSGSRKGRALPHSTRQSRISNPRPNIQFGQS